MIFVQNCTNTDTDIFIYTLHICLINIYIYMLCVYLQVIINSIAQLK